MENAAGPRRVLINARDRARRSDDAAGGGLLQIRDGERRVRATRLGRHEALWRVAGGYIVDDWVAASRRTPSNDAPGRSWGVSQPRRS
jgi:hypothetical protein